MHDCWKFDRQLHWFVIRDRAEFELCHILSSLSPVRLEYQIAVDDHADREARPDRQRRLDIEIAPNDLLTGLVEGIPCPTSQRLNNVAVVAAGAEFGPNAKQSGKCRGFEQFAPVVVDFVLEAGVTRRIGTRLAFEHDEAPVWHYEAGPDQEHARLPKSDLAIIDPDQSRALGINRARQGGVS